MNPKSQRWLFIVLWSCVLGIIITDIMALVILKPIHVSTYVLALLIAIVTVAMVYGLQVLITRHKNPFTLFNKGVL